MREKTRPTLCPLRSITQTASDFTEKILVFWHRVCHYLCAVNYDQIRAYLEGELEEARAVHAREQRAETSRAVRVARERYEQFVLHGLIPEDLPEEPPVD